MVSIIPFPNNPLFSLVCITNHVQKLWEREKLLILSNLSFSHSVFYPFGELSAIFYQIQNCLLQTLSVWKSLRFVIWKGIKKRNNESPMKLISFEPVKKRFYYSRISCFPVGYREIAVKIFFDLTLVPPVKNADFHVLVV